MDISQLNLGELYDLRRDINAEISRIENGLKDQASIAATKETARKEQNAMIMFPVTEKQFKEIQTGDLKERVKKFQTIFPNATLSDYANWSNGNRKRF